ncbi:hypothetical protein HO133_005951 [Letharia lupina]|uniref:Cytochrome P450 n=1 Tax=Letharia lupina TaxID=560253 RepID=A0A8H6F806_9LECA|nr:uncharacterized protein HO133_005951 [Letharia lupina]KAF6218600.1 hypothetical protein HO133_005951 [Letharia lupina]
MVSVGDPAEIPNLYSFTGKFTKSDFYHVIVFYAKGKPVQTIFTTQDENLHRMLKRPIAGIYTMSNLMSFEPYVDTTISFFFAQLDKRFAQTGDICNLGTWLQMFAFDVMGELTFSKRLGFLERAEDVDGIMESIWHYFQKTTPVTQIPWVDRLWAKNPIFQRLKAVRMNPIAGFGLARIAERKSAPDTSDNKESSTNSRDFLSRFLEAQAKDKTIPPWALTAWTTSNIAAGSDTTAILLRTTIYSLLSHPATLSRLLSELDSLPPSSVRTSTTFKQARSLPYLDACIKEAGRLHPPFGLPLERVVPPEGATVCRQRFTGGTVVGMSPWVVHRDQDVFGEDAGVWRPERWLDCDNEQRRRMEAGLLTFGAGHRACIGKNISYLEVYKLIPSLLRTYEIAFAEPGCPGWRVENRWFVNQTGLNVRLKRRDDGEGKKA